MELAEIVSMVAKMFPNSNVRGALEQAKQLLPQHLPNDIKGAKEIARQLGMDGKMAQEIFDRYGKTVQARTICSMLGTTPEALKEDADRLLGEETREERRFPRLK